MGVPFSSRKGANGRQGGGHPSISSSTSSSRSSLEEEEEEEEEEEDAEEGSHDEMSDEEGTDTAGSERRKHVKQVEEKFASAADVIAEKAEEFWREIKDLQVPNPTEGKTIEQILDDILNHEWDRNEIDWRRGEDNEDDRAYELRLARRGLKRIRKNMSVREVIAAKSVGLLDKNGKIPKYDLHSNNHDSVDLVKKHGLAVPFVIWGWRPEEAARFRTATNDLVKFNVCNLIRNFQMMTNDSTRMLVKVLMEAGIWGLGLDGLTAVRNVIGALPEVTKATEAYAILEGIFAVGENVVRLAIRTATLGILAPLFARKNETSAAIIAIMNESSDDLRLEDLYLSYGNAVGVFNEQATLKAPKRIIPKMLPPIVNQKTGKVLASASIQGGFFVARKKDKSLTGSAGVLEFEASRLFPKGILVAWSVPFAYDTNRIRVLTDSEDGYISVSVETGSSTYRDSQDSTSVSGTGAKVIGRLDAKKGTVAYGIVRVADPPKDASVPELQSGSNDKASMRNEMVKDIEVPDVTSGKTHEEQLEDIMNHEKKHHGIDWRAAIEQGSRGIGSALLKAHGRLQKIRKAMSKHEVDTLKSMGLLDANGDVKELDLLGGEAGIECNLAPIPSRAGTFPCLAWTRDEAAKFQNAKGDEIKELVFNLVRSFQLMEKSDETALAHFFMKRGLIALGGSAAQAVWKTMETMEKASEVVVAIAEGILATGLGAIRFMISNFVLTILVPIFIHATEDAAQLMVIVNDTDEDISLKDIATIHGKIVGVFKETANQSNARPLIPRRRSAVCNKDGLMTSSGTVFAGFCCSRKMDDSPSGPQGAMRFAATTLYPKGVSIGWDVPVSGGGNRLLVSADSDDDTRAFSDKAGKNGQPEETSSSSKDGTVVGRVSSGYSGRAFNVINIATPVGETVTSISNKAVAESIKDHPQEEALPPTTIGADEVAEDKSNEELLNQILDHERDVNGIDWREAVKAGKPAVHEAIKKAREHLKAIGDKMTKEERHHALEMGLLNEKGEVPEFDLLAEHEGPSEMELSAVSAPSHAPTPVSIPSSAAPYMVWGWKPSVASQYENAKGSEIKSRILKLVQTFQAIKKDDKAEMAKAFMIASLWGVGRTGLKAAWRAMEAVADITEEAELEAIAEGIEVVGVTVVTMAIATCVLAVLVPIAIFMNKNAVGIMVIINDTDEDMVMTDLHTTHGKVVGIFKEKAALDNPQPILPKRLQPIINPITKKVMLDGAVVAGFVAARKHDSALYGSQGSMQFGPTERYPQGVSLGWEVPLTQSPNCLLVSAKFTGSASEFSNETNSHGETTVSSQSTVGAVVTGRLNSGGGSEAYYIFSIK